MNKNEIITDGWSNEQSKSLYENEWPDEPAMKVQATEDCLQCGGCSFFAPFNADWGLCCHRRSRHHLETVFEHFSCPEFEDEGWGPHSFTTMKELHCRCNGEPREYWDKLAAMMQEWKTQPRSP